MPDPPSSPATPDDILHVSASYSGEGFALVAIENHGGQPVTLTMVGIWLPAAAMGWDFGPSRACKAHPYAGLPYALAPGATGIFPINAVQSFLRVLDDTPDGKPHLPGDESILQA